MMAQKGFRVRTWMDPRKVRQAVNQASLPPLRAAAFLVEVEAKRSLSIGGGTASPGDPNAYYHSGLGRWVTASPPGEPPHLQTGDLRNSISTAATFRMTYLVGPTVMAWYGKVHEFSGKFHPRRAFMRPALRRVRSRFPHLFKSLRLAVTPAGRELNMRGKRGLGGIR